MKISEDKLVTAPTTLQYAIYLKIIQVSFGTRRFDVFSHFKAAWLTQNEKLFYNYFVMLLMTMTF